MKPPGTTEDDALNGFGVKLDYEQLQSDGNARDFPLETQPHQAMLAVNDVFYLAGLS